MLESTSPLKSPLPNIIDKKSAKALEVYLRKRNAITYPMYLKYLALNVSKGPMKTNELKKAIINMIVFLADWLQKIETAEKKKPKEEKT